MLNNRYIQTNQFFNFFIHEQTKSEQNIKLRQSKHIILYLFSKGGFLKQTVGEISLHVGVHELITLSGHLTITDRMLINRSEMYKVSITNKNFILIN